MSAEIAERLHRCIPGAADGAREMPGTRVPDIAGPLEQSGHADVVYTTTDAPVGRVLLAATEQGLVALRYVFTEQDLDRELGSIARRLTPRIVAAHGRLEQPRRELDEFFSGERRAFTLPLDWSLVKAGFTRTVLEATALIPFGHTISYKEIARRAGNERAFRAAGGALGSNPLPIVIPCHRVLNTGGGLGGYTGGLEIKRELLELEGALPSRL